MPKRLCALGLTLLAAAPSLVAEDSPSWRNGKRFDPGVTMTARAPGAPEELDRVAGLVGRYDVELTRFVADGEPVVSRGQAEITFINRGHALMESFFTPDLEGRRHASVYFLGYNPTTGRWFLGGADSTTERAWVADGVYGEDRLVLTDTRRLNGGIGRTELRYLVGTTDEGLEITVDRSTDAGASWSAVEKRLYERRSEPAELLAVTSDYGSPRPDRPAEAAGFDFLIGEWEEAQQMTFPNGQQAQWASDGTAVHVLDGAAVLEYTWFDVDPRLPDAATTILRLYNRAMRRWECLYVPNRGHSILYFGGHQEDERIVLGNFEADSSAAAISHYIFHSIEKDSYGWYSQQSRDRGATWVKNWIIRGQRKTAAAPEAAQGSATGGGS